MEQYRNLSGESNVAAYQIGRNNIHVRFKEGDIYIYNYVKTGSPNVEHMKELAKAGRGLNTYINRFVKFRYASKY